VIIGIEPVIGLDGNDIGAKPPRFAHEDAGFDAEGFGRVAGGNRAGRIRERLHDDDGLIAERRIFLLFARCKKGVEIEEEPLDGRLGIVHLLFYTAEGPYLASPAVRMSWRRAGGLKPGRQRAKELT
jgi:hypothetical protein